MRVRLAWPLATVALLGLSSGLLPAPRAAAQDAPPVAPPLPPPAPVEPPAPIPSGPVASPPLRAPAATPADEPPPIAPAWVRIAEVEHRRTSPKALDEFLAATTSADVRRRAIVALGRIGDRAGVEGRLRDLLRRGGDDLPLVAWAAGVSGQAGLTPDLLALLPTDVMAATSATPATLEAVGQLKDARAVGYVRPWVASNDATLAVAALEALMRLGDDEALEDALGALDRPEAAVRRAAAFAAWRLAGARRTARGADRWSDDGLAWRVVRAAARERDAEVRIPLYRALNALTPKELHAVDAAQHARPDAFLLDAAADADARVAGDVAFRLGRTHAGAETLRALSVAAGSTVPLVRETALEALEQQPGDDAAKALAAAVEATANAADRADRDAVLGTAVATAGAPAANAPAPLRDTAATRRALRGLVRAKTVESRARLDAVLARADLAVPLRAFLLEAVADDDGFDGRAAALRDVEHRDPVVRAQAAALLGKAMHHADDRAAYDAAALALVRAYEQDPARTGQDARAGVLEAVGEFPVVTDVDGPLRELVARGLTDTAPVVRLAARKVAAKIPALAERAKAEEPTPNEWRGLPRPKTPILGVDLTQGDGWLRDEEILRLARAITAKGATVVFETNRGTMRVRLDADAAPVHAANVVLAAAAGVYDGTPWHRVVPAFVIQGGDPRGDGSGDAGYAIPDELTPRRFERGVLGMPKSTKDTGGVQLFFMHCAAPHLDGGYTAYGVVVEGLDVIDRIVVGDTLLHARVD